MNRTVKPGHNMKQYAFSFIVNLLMVWLLNTGKPKYLPFQKMQKVIVTQHSDRESKLFLHNFSVLRFFNISKASENREKALI